MTASNETPKRARAKADVDAFLHDLKHERKADVLAVRTIVLDADAKLVERIKWNAPSYGYDDDRVTFRLQPKDVVQLVFHRGAKRRADAFVFEDETGLLAWLAPDRAAVTFGDHEDIAGKADDLARLVRSWMGATH